MGEGQVYEILMNRPLSVRRKWKTEKRLQHRPFSQSLLFCTCDCLVDDKIRPLELNPHDSSMQNPNSKYSLENDIIALCKSLTRLQLRIFQTVNLFSSTRNSCNLMVLVSDLVEKVEKTTNSHQQQTNSD